MRYVKSEKQGLLVDEIYTKPTLEVSNVISVLISAEFLQMGQLVDDCANFVVSRISEIVRLPIDMKCLSSNITKKIAAKMEVEDIDFFRDKRDRLKSKLFMNKLEQVFENPENFLHLCSRCHTLFTDSQRDWMRCPAGDLYIDAHGHALSHHMADRKWDLQKFIMFLREKSVSWREIFWLMWGRLEDFKCTECNQKFVASEMDHCSYHTLKPYFKDGSNIG